MIRPEQAPLTHATQAPERGAALVLCPVAALFPFIVLPIDSPAATALSVSPPTQRICSSIAVGQAQQRIRSAPRPHPDTLSAGPSLGTRRWSLLGSINALVILYLVPHLGGDYRFLADTPHAKIPMWIMLPWFIGFIAVMVELNFRGFQLGRLLRLEALTIYSRTDKCAAVCLRSLSGGNLSPAPLDRRLGRITVGNSVGHLPKPVHYDRGPCSRGHGAVWCDADRTRLNGGPDS